jgi:hypothetical protein
MPCIVCRVTSHVFCQCIMSWGTVCRCTLSLSIPRSEVYREVWNLANWERKFNHFASGEALHICWTVWSVGRLAETTFPARASFKQNRRRLWSQIILWRYLLSTITCVPCLYTKNNDRWCHNQRRWHCSDTWTHIFACLNVQRIWHSIHQKTRFYSESCRF